MPDRAAEVVVITGASAGIGRAAVREFGRHGAMIALIAREPERLEAARSKAERRGSPRAIAIPVDTSALAYRSIPLQSPYCGARSVSPEFWAAKHRGWLWGAAAPGVGLPGLSKRRKG